MAKPDSEPLTGTVIDHRIEVTLDEVTLFCATRQETICALVEEGVLQPRGRARAEWRFDGIALHRAAKALRLQRDLDVNLEAVALILDLLDEVESLRARIGPREGM
jgi:chaperone modulatory protein CbpM